MLASAFKVTAPSRRPGGHQAQPAALVGIAEGFCS
jgi:hypothetical protein